MTSKLKSFSIALLTGASLMLSGCANRITQPNVLQRSGDNTAALQTNGVGGITAKQKSELANLTFKNGTYGYVRVNNNKSTLNPKAWKENKVIYQNLDNLNRTSSSNIGFLEKKNLANGSLRVRQTIQPTGWHYNSRNGEQLYNRGHLIAYSVSAGIDMNGRYNPNNQSGDQNNPKNLFTQSAYSNQQLQTIYEKKIRNALRTNKKVIYQATPIFKGTNKMANGINLQAISTDRSLNFNVYIFNVQPGYSFNFANGRAKKNNSVRVKELPINLQSHYNNQNSRKHRRNYYNRQGNQRQAERDFKNFERENIRDAENYVKRNFHKGRQFFSDMKNWYDENKNQK